MDENRGLVCEQFEVGQDNHVKYIKFDGRSTKTLTGGLCQRNQSAKSIRHYSTVCTSYILLISKQSEMPAFSTDDRC